MKIALRLSLLSFALSLVACASKNVSTISTVEKIANNGQYSEQTAKAKFMAMYGTMSSNRSPASSAVDIEATSEADYSLLSSVSNYTKAGQVITKDAVYDAGILSISIGPDMNPQALVLVLNAGQIDAMAFVLPTYASKVKTAKVNKKKVSVRISQMQEFDKAPFIRPVDACLEINMSDLNQEGTVILQRKVAYETVKCINK